MMWETNLTLPRLPSRTIGPDPFQLLILILGIEPSLQPSLGSGASHHTQ